MHPLQPAPSLRVVVTDGNILINLSLINRLDLIRKLPPYSFVIPEQVVKEVKDPAQAAAIEAAISSGMLEEIQLTAIGELTIYGELVQIMGIGEAACLSLAQSRGWLIASDEKKKFQKETLTRRGPARLLNTAGIFLHAIKLGVVTLEDADHAKVLLEARKLKMQFASFRDILPK